MPNTAHTSAAGMSARLTLISHNLCPYVQRAEIVLLENNVPHERQYIDLADKPDWFNQISPLGKVPLLCIVGARGGAETLFESAAICEYLNETGVYPLLPANPISRAQHRAWIEFASNTLDLIGGFYSAATADALNIKTQALRQRFELLGAQLGKGPYFSGHRFGLVDAAFAPVFRYFTVFDEIADFGVFSGCDKVNMWRAALAERPSVRAAVTADYPDNLWAFLRRRGSYISALLKAQPSA